MAVKITSRRELEAWLEDKPIGWAQVIARRAALRAALGAIDPKSWHLLTEHSRAILGGLRALLILSAIAESSAVPSGRLAQRAYVAANHSANIAYAEAKRPAYAAFAAIAMAASSARSSLAKDAISYAQSSIGAVADPDGSEFIESATASIWEMVQRDCNYLEDGPGSHLSFVDQHLWQDAPEWLLGAWDSVRKWFSASGEGFEIWREWYYGRIKGLPHAFADFDNEADEGFYSWIVKQDNKWWSRGPAEVNRDIAEFVDSLRKPKVPSDEELEQNPRAFTFSLDTEGLSTLDEDPLPNGLQGDDDERDNHGEILRLIEAALFATAGDTNAKAISEPTQLLKEAVGDTVEDLRPRLFVLRARDVIRWVDESNSEDMRIPGLSKAQSDAFMPLVAALEMIAEFSPKLAQLWHGKLGQTGTPLTRQMLDLIAVALRNSGQTTALAQSVIEASNRQVAPDAPEDDPARVAASETSRNVVRKMGGTLKKAGDGAESAEKIISLGERVASVWNSLRGKLPSGEVIARILGHFGGG